MLLHRSRKHRARGTFLTTACDSEAVGHDSDHTHRTAPITAAPISTEEPDEQATKKIRPSTLRKSVSFTPDTKAKDGETGQKYFKAWASGQDPTAIDPSAEEEPESPSRSPVEETAKPVKAPKPKKAKKPKKSKSTSLDTKSSKSAVAEDTAETEPVETPAYVAYLQQYHSDKDNWKFNKKKQNDLLKNLFNIRRLPEKYEPAIIAYVSGLQGVARERLAAQAEEVLKGIYEKESGDSAEDMSLSSSDARKAAYYGAMLRQIQNCEERGGGRDEHSDEQLRELREEVLGAKRAQTMIEHALKMELHPEQFRVVPSSVTTTTTTPTPEHPNRVEKSKRRKRKTRTTGSTSSDDSSSSSDDSSSSESDSDGDVEESEKKSASVMPPRKPIFGKELLDQAFPNTKAKQQAEESSSSDDSSDSDSDSSGA